MHHSEYTVQWEIQVDGTSPRDAAKEALAIQRLPNATATVFTVIDQRGIAHKIDLEESEVECCPFCKSESVSTDTVEWQAQSTDPTDLDNKATLTEHRCNDCGKSFWS